MLEGRLAGFAVRIALTVVGVLVAENLPAGDKTPERAEVARWITPAASNVPMATLAPGDQPPQFILFSFDGVGSHDKMVEFLATAAPSDARFTGFLSGTYLLTDDNSAAYSAPGAEPGTSSIGFGGDLAEVTQRVADLNDLYARGNEIGTHYNGHFCGLGAGWSTADWNSELDQFYRWFDDWKAANKLTEGADLRVPSSAVTGGRTPCLAGQFDELIPAWTARGMTYDTSGENDFTGIAWPTVEEGVWQFPIPTVHSPALVAAGRSPLVKAMDYNFWHKLNGAVEQPEVTAQLTEIALETYRFMYEQAYAGNRAPVLIANHFNDWNGNAFNPAVRQFMTETCGRPETICATYQDVIAWMELQEPGVLADLQALPPVAVTASAG